MGYSEDSISYFDADGDGFHDLVVGGNDRVSLFPAPAIGTLLDAIVLDAETAGDNAGAHVDIARPVAATKGFDASA